MALGPIKVQNCIIADNHLCAGGFDGKGPCRVSCLWFVRTKFIFLSLKGDSGGALLAQDRKLQGWSAIGIVSYQPGADCGTDNYVVFTEIRKYLPWIASQFGLLPPLT